MIVISLGSNLGNRFDNLREAVKLIEQLCLQNVRRSIVIETEAILPEYAKNDWNRPFLNMIICGETALSPKELLNELKNIERKIGRLDEYERWSPRIIDLDILLYNDLIVDTTDLKIPHPEIKNRSFIKHLLSLMNFKTWASEYIERSFIRSYLLQPELVGVVNITKDSFSDGGKFYDPGKAAQQILYLDDQGASFIEVGAQSTRPGALIQSAEEEYTQFDRYISPLNRIKSS
jgi:2-amino-4-hydroxy-6-hydroxymethyldihydropteridine diphosphokinase/dihydropteroate synthase